ncbi:MAG TPA: ABC transporter ATP-binding protein [Sporichthyaceae bacterium]|nr:ABC transporter ATP-binding protein [Sporichthyaceae bacterium]
MATSIAAPVELVGVTKAFGERIAVADVSFALAAGAVTGFLGPNGAGKSTSLRMIGGLLRPSAGRVTLFGRDARRPAARACLGYMPADPTFVLNLTGHQNLDLLAKLRGSDSPERATVAAALDLPERDLDLPVRAFSSGMRQKLAIIAALQHRPELVVLDEPANRLDPLAHHAFCAVIAGVARSGRTVLLSSHVLTEVEEVCDTVILMRDGRLLQTSGVAELQRQASREVTLTYSAPPRRVLNALTAVQVDGSVVRGRIPAHRTDILRELLHGEPGLVDLTVVPVSLEELFRDLYVGGGP